LRQREHPLLPQVGGHLRLPGHQCHIPSTIKLGLEYRMRTVLREHRPNFSDPKGKPYGVKHA
jgi:hypothetical protein